MIRFHRNHGERASQEVLDMVFLVCALVTIPVTWVLMVFWNSLGMQLTYWDAYPLSGATVFLLAVLISAMTMDLEPREPEVDALAGEPDQLVPNLAVVPVEVPRANVVTPWQGLYARPAAGPPPEPVCDLPARKTIGRGVGDGFEGPQLRLFGEDEMVHGRRASGDGCEVPPPLLWNPLPDRPVQL